VTVLSSKPLKKQALLIIAVLAASAAIVALLFWSAPENKPEAQPLVAVKVSPFKVTASTIKPSVTVTGRLQPANRALLRFEVSGQLAERLVEPGQRVKTGDVLLRLSDADARDALAEADARLEMEKAAVKRDRRLLEIAAKDVVLQEQEVKRLQKLRSNSLVSISLGDQAKQKLLQLQSNQAQLRYSVDTANARLKSARASQARAARNLQRTELLATFDGTVNVVNIEEGDYVTPSTVSVELVDLENIDLYVEVTGDTASAIALQQRVNVVVNGQQHRGTIIALRSNPDPVTFTHAIRIRLESKKLLPGTLGLVELPLQVQKSVLPIPVSSILQEEGRSYVFVIKAGTLERREVQLGTRNKDSFVVQSGLQEGEQVVARDIASLTDEQSVELFKK